MSAKKKEVDVLLVERGLIETREKQNAPLWRDLYMRMR